MDTRTAIALGALLVAVTGGSVKAVDYFAKQSDLVELAMDFQEERKFNRLDRLEERQWNIESKYERYNSSTGEVTKLPMSQWEECDKKEYQKLEQERRRLRGE